MRTFFRKYYRITPIVLLLLCIAVGYPSASSSAQRARTTRAPREILEDLLKDTDFVEMLPPPMDSVAPNVIADPLHLSRNGGPELEVRAVGYICGSPQNCPACIYRRHGAGYERLLDAGGIEALEPQQTFTHGYRMSWPSGTALHGRTISRSTSSTGVSTGSRHASLAGTAPETVMGSGMS